MRKLIKSLLKKTNWRLKKIYRNKSYTNEVPKKELLDAMLACNGIIHMGAHRGGEAPIYDWFNKKTIWIEANPEIMDDLNDNLAQYINQKSFQALLSDKDNNLENFNISSNDSASSSIFTFGDYSGIHNKIKMIKTKQIKTCRLDTLIRKNDIEIDDYNFWVIDLQGSELLALQGAGALLQKCKFMLIEISKENIYQGGVSWKILNDFLINNNFYPAWKTEKVHTDVLYIRKQN